jgi:hypothetical protein
MPHIEHIGLSVNPWMKSNLYYAFGREIHKLLF